MNNIGLVSENGKYIHRYITKNFLGNKSKVSIIFNIDFKDVVEIKIIIKCEYILYKSYFYREGTLKFTKVSDYGPSKIAVYNTTVWAEATLKFEEWKEVFKGEENVKDFVHGDFHFVSSIWEKNGVRYSGIHRLNGRGEIISKTGLNMDNYEWVNVMKKVEDINVGLYGPQAKKGEKRRTSPNEVQVWSYIYYLNGEEVKRKEPMLQFFSEGEARSIGELNYPEMKLKKTDNLEMKIVSEYTSRPSEYLQMRMVLHQVVKGAVGIARSQKCYACNMDPPSPSQKDHMQSGGCMDENSFDAAEYVNVVMGVIKPEDLIALYNTICRYLGIFPGPTTVMAQGILAWYPKKEIAESVQFDVDTSLDEEEWKDDETDPLLMYQNVPLKHLVRDVYHDMNIGADMNKRIKERYIELYKQTK